MERWEVDLKNTKNSMLVGDIGEVVALHYLTNHGFFSVNRPIKFLHSRLFLISAHYQQPKIDRVHWLTEEQKEYLEKNPSWDYVAFKPEGIKRSPPFLIEVKTIRGKGSPHKKINSKIISEARTLGFKPMLIIVRLLDNWKVSVQVTEL